MQFQSMSISLLYMYRVYLATQNCLDGVVLILSNVCGTSEMKLIKHLSQLNKSTVWYVTAVLGFMGWYVALFWEDCKYFCCSSQNNLMKSEIFLWAVSKIIDLKSLLKSALTGKDALMFLLEVALTSFQVLCRSFHKFEL